MARWKVFSVSLLPLCNVVEMIVGENDPTVAHAGSLTTLFRCCACRPSVTSAVVCSLVLMVGALGR